MKNASSRVATHQTGFPPRSRHPVNIGEATMRSKRYAVLMTFVALSLLCGSGSAQAGTGTLKGIFAYKDPVTGVERVLSPGYAYLHRASTGAPMEKYLS